MTKISSNTQVVLLLTTHISKPGKGDPEPLNISEWNILSGWFNDKGLQIGDLLTGDPVELFYGWKNEKCSIERIQYLLNRGTALALAVEKWQRVGIWVLVRSDSEYPGLLKERLKNHSPPVLFGCGNKRLLNSSCIGVVGSRDADNEDLDFARTLGKKLVDSERSVVSGGARGIDEAAMLSALERDGTVIGVLADNLFKAVFSQKYRAALKQQNLVLISPFYPEAGFNAGNAMARNKYIYCISDATIVVHSGTTGGTWNGALENLRKGWAPVWVKWSTGKYSGNSLIVQRGGKWLPKEIFESNLNAILKPKNIDKGLAEQNIGQSVTEQQTIYHSGTEEDLLSDDMKGDKTASKEWQDKSLYDVFCLKLELMLANGPLESEGLHEKFNITETRMKVWLKQAIDNGLIVKRNKPLRYELAKDRAHKQMNLF
ncbi:MAG: DNA-processing protein DprA [Proteobacteria bacterium]|nr:DNA-processing protein DprA [Pseudomonadota bacterium]